MNHERTLRRVFALVVMSGAVLLLLVAARGVLARVAPPVKLSQAPLAQGSPTQWNSGWIPLAPGTCSVLTHGLGIDPQDLAVEMWFRDDDGLGMHRRGFGGLDVDGVSYGAHWQELTSDTVRVCRGPDDDLVDALRIRVMQILSPPVYDSGWVNIAPGQTRGFPHSANVTETELAVSMWFSHPVLGIHSLGYGGLAIQELNRLAGAHWHNLTADTIRVTRHPTDPFVSQVRVVVVRPETPSYDSLTDPSIGDWQPIAAGEVFTFEHNLGYSPDLMVVRAECYSSEEPIPDPGIHQWFAGGNHDWFQGYQGANLQNVDRDTVAVYRQPDDEVCPYARVRIWKRRGPVYVPLVLYEP